MFYRGSFQNDFGELIITLEKDYIIRLEFRKPDSEEYVKWCKRYLNEVPEPLEKAPPEVCELFDKCAGQLRAYFNGTRKVFDLPLKLLGTDFQRRCWAELLKISYGETCSYKDIAAAVGCPKGTRPVGGANNKNPISIIVPCHRVIGKNGSLTGYGGGLPLKEKLLRLEREGADAGQ